MVFPRSHAAEAVISKSVASVFVYSDKLLLAPI